MAASLAISNQEERDNFFRLTLLLFRVGNQQLREFFKSRWPIVYQNKTGVPPPVVPWNDTPNDATEMNKIETKLKFQFTDQKKSFDSGNTNNWDFSILTTVLINSSLDFVTAASPENKAIKDIKEIRNKLIAHAPDARIPTAVFKTEWPKACQALIHFKATQVEFDDVKNDVEKPIDSLLPVLKECLSNDKDILDAINKLEGNNELRHRETLKNIKQGNEDIKEAINEVKEVLKEYHEPKASSSKQLKMKEAERTFIQQRLKYFEKDVIATELLDFLSCLTDEQKDEIAYNENNYTTEKGLRTLVEKLEEFDDGFEMFVRALLQADLGHVAVLLDTDCTDYEEQSMDDEEVSHGYVSIDGTAFDVKIPLRIHVGDIGARRVDLEEQIAVKFNAGSSVDSKKLRKEFNKFLHKGVYFVRTKQLGERKSEDMVTDAAKADNSAKTRDSVVLVFRVAKVTALDELWEAYSNGDLNKRVRQVMMCLSLPCNGGDLGSLELEMLFQEKDYREIKTILNGGAEIDEECTSSTEVNEDETMETPVDIHLTKETTRIRKVYLEDNYHKEIELRDYQKELAAPAFEGKNTVICAPTNSGKTFVAMEIAKRHLNAYRDSDSRKPKVVFVVNKQNLVFQQRARFEEYLTHYKISDISGSNSSNTSLKSQLSFCDVVVLTAQILVDALQYNTVKITDISLLLFDECHHTQKDGPYNKIMRSYIGIKRANGGDSEETLPQVVGFTASLGVGQAKFLEKAIEHILQSCANLDASSISTVRDNKEDLNKHVTCDTLDVRVIEVANDQPNVFEVEVNKTMKSIEVFLKESCKYDDPPTADRQTESYRQWIELLQNNASVRQNREQFTYAEHLRSYHEALLINAFARIADATSYLEDCFNKYDPSKSTETCLSLHEVYQSTKSLIEQNVTSGQTCNPLLSTMESLIIGFLESENDSSSAKGIVFCRTRAFAVAIKKWIEETTSLKDILKPDILLGSGGGQYSMTQADQEAVIKKFKNGDINIIIATSVAEEGLDIADCSYVIRYSVKTNEISHVQSRGRVRAKKGNYVYLSDKRSRGAEHELKNQSKETLMDAAVNKVQEMTREEFIEKIQRIQAIALDIEKRKAESDSAKSAIQEIERVSFLCKKCGKLICYGHDIRKIYTNHHVVISKDIYERITIKQHEKPYPVNKRIHVSQKVYCKCDYDLGIIVTIQGMIWPCIKIGSFAVQFCSDCEPVLCKKWSKFPYSIIEVKVQDLGAAQMGQGSLVAETSLCYEHVHKESRRRSEEEEESS